MRRETRIALLALVAIAGAAAGLGCGVKSPPIPPEDARPQQTLDLEATSLRGGVRVVWHRPERYAGGMQMKDLASFTLSRSEGDAPYIKIADIPVTDQDRFQVQRTFTYVDHDTEVGKTYHYQLTTSTSDGYVSKPSNTASVTRSNPPPPPNPDTYQLPTPTPIP
jgi:hypothetical protein